MSSNIPAISIVMPLYREGAHFGSSFSELDRHVRMSGETFEYILVDDGSDDETWDVVERLCAGGNPIRGLRLARNFGKEAAIRAGLAKVRGAAAIVMDGDLEHPPQLIPALVRRWRESDAHVVNAVKVQRGRESLAYRLSVQIHATILRAISGMDMRGASDFKLLTRPVIDAYLDLGERRLFFRGLVHWMGFRQASVEMQVEDRAGGDTSWSLRQLFRLALTSFTSFSTSALHLITLIGLLFLLVAVCLGLSTLWTWWTGNAVEGFATVICLQLFIGSTVLIALGIIGEYLATIYVEIKARPLYLVMQECQGNASGNDG